MKFLFTCDYIDNDSDESAQLEINTNGASLAHALLATFNEQHASHDFELISFVRINDDQFAFTLKCPNAIADGFDYVATGFCTRV